jgi:ubiquinone/menaquinone biosynthesis C-methylase UbiE
MEAALQRRVQRYGWDRAAAEYDPAWQSQLAATQARVVACAALVPGERVLDVACGTGLVTRAAASAVGPRGHVLGVDLSAGMIEAARRRTPDLDEPRFVRMDAERLDLADGSFDAAVCALGLMYMPDPARAVAEMRRVVRPGGRVAMAVWGERAHCGWSPLFRILDAEVTSEVCPLFFRLGEPGVLARACARAGLVGVEEQRLRLSLDYASEDDACRAAFVGGPVALAWSRFGDEARERVRERYVEAIAPWRHAGRYRIPGEFVVVAARVPAAIQPGSP